MSRDAFGGGYTLYGHSVYKKMRRDASIKGRTPPMQISKKINSLQYLLRRDATASLHIIASLQIFGQRFFRN